MNGKGDLSDDDSDLENDMHRAKAAPKPKVKKLDHRDRLPSQPHIDGSLSIPGFGPTHMTKSNSEFNMSTGYTYVPSQVNFQEALQQYYNPEPSMFQQQNGLMYSGNGSMNQNTMFKSVSPHPNPQLVLNGSEVPIYGTPPNNMMFHSDQANHSDINQAHTPDLSVSLNQQHASNYRSNSISSSFSQSGIEPSTNPQPGPMMPQDMANGYAYSPNNQSFDSRGFASSTNDMTSTIASDPLLANSMTTFANHQSLNIPSTNMQQSQSFTGVLPIPNIPSPQVSSFPPTRHHSRQSSLDQKAGLRLAIPSKLPERQSVDYTNNVYPHQEGSQVHTSAPTISTLSLAQMQKSNSNPVNPSPKVNDFYANFAKEISIQSPLTCNNSPITANPFTNHASSNNPFPWPSSSGMSKSGSSQAPTNSVVKDSDPIVKTEESSA